MPTRMARTIRDVNAGKAASRVAPGNQIGFLVCLREDRRSLEGMFPKCGFTHTHSFGARPHIPRHAGAICLLAVCGCRDDWRSFRIGLADPAEACWWRRHDLTGPVVIGL